MSKLVFGRDVKIETHREDKYRALLPVCACWIALMSITCSLEKAGVGGIGSMRLGTWYMKN